MMKKICVKLSIFASCEAIKETLRGSKKKTKFFFLFHLRILHPTSSLCCLIFCLDVFSLEVKVCRIKSWMEMEKKNKVFVCLKMKIYKTCWRAIEFCKIWIKKLFEFIIGVFYNFININHKFILIHY